MVRLRQTNVDELSYGVAGLKTFVDKEQIRWESLTDFENNFQESNGMRIYTLGGSLYKDIARCFRNENNFSCAY